MKKRLKLIIWPIIYLVLIVNVCISFIMVFRSYYFKSIFVSGSSMEPTLNGNIAKDVDFGLIDDHKNAIDKIKRFQIITTYYPFEDSKDYSGGYVHGETNTIDEREASYKIKRVYGLPGETIKFAVNQEEADEALRIALERHSYDDAEAQIHAQNAIEFYVKGPKDNDFVKQDIKFKRKINITKIGTYNYQPDTLSDDEYWVMGDNYKASSDCFTKKAPIYYDNIVGVLISIEGTCKIFSDVKINEDDDGTKISYKCTNRKYHLPVYY